MQERKTKIFLFYHPAFSLSCEKKRIRMPEILVEQTISSSSAKTGQIAVFLLTDKNNFF